MHELSKSEILQNCTCLYDLHYLEIANPSRCIVASGQVVACLRSVRPVRANEFGHLSSESVGRVRAVDQNKINHKEHPKSSEDPRDHRIMHRVTPTTPCNPLTLFPIHSILNLEGRVF